MEPVEARERALSRLGAVWRPPLLLDVRSQPWHAHTCSTENVQGRT